MVCIMVAMCGAAFLFNDFSDDYEKSKEALEIKVKMITASTNALSSQYDSVKHNGTLLEKILQLQSRNRLGISLQTVKNRFNRLRDQYYLGNLHLSMAPIAEMQDADHKRASQVIVSSEVVISFTAVSDEYAYSLLNSIQQDLAGSSKITSFTLTRDGDVTNDALRVMSDTGTAPLVKGEIKFVWFGIKPIESNDTANAAKTP